jgi:hypothetical protein
VSKTLRLSMIATLALATSVLGILSYNILNPKEPEPKAAEVVAPVPVPPPPEPPKKKVVWLSAREEPRSIRILTPNKEGGFTAKKCWNFECE